MTFGRSRDAFSRTTLFMRQTVFSWLPPLFGATKRLKGTTLYAWIQDCGRRPQKKGLLFFPESRRFFFNTSWRHSLQSWLC